MTAADVAEPLVEEETGYQVQISSVRQQVLIRLLDNRPALAGLAMLALVILLALLAPRWPATTRMPWT
jgi:hypothetical protein